MIEHKLARCLKATSNLVVRPATFLTFCNRIGVLLYETKSMLLMIWIDAFLMMVIPSLGWGAIMALAVTDMINFVGRGAHAVRAGYTVGTGSVHGVYGRAARQQWKVERYELRNSVERAVTAAVRTSSEHTLGILQYKLLLLLAAVSSLRDGRRAYMVMVGYKATVL